MRKRENPSRVDNKKQPKGHDDVISWKKILG